MKANRINNQRNRNKMENITQKLSHLLFMPEKSFSPRNRGKKISLNDSLNDN